MKNNESLISDFQKYLEIERNYSNNTIDSYTSDLTEFFDYTDKKSQNITENNIRRYIEYLFDVDRKRTTINRKISTIRSFFNFLTIDEMNNLLNNMKEEDILDLRNKLIFELLYATGLRVSELVNLKKKKIDFSNNNIRIIGKGNKER